MLFAAHRGYFCIMTGFGGSGGFQIPELRNQSWGKVRNIPDTAWCVWVLDSVWILGWCLDPWFVFGSLVGVWIPVLTLPLQGCRTCLSPLPGCSSRENFPSFLFFLHANPVDLSREAKAPAFFIGGGICLTESQECGALNFPQNLELCRDFGVAGGKSWDLSPP